MRVTTDYSVSHHMYTRPMNSAGPWEQRSIMATANQPGTTYRTTFDRAADDPATFWLEQAETLDWHTEPTRGLDYDGKTSWKWFPDGQLNITYQALDRWVQAGRGEQPAIVWDSAMTDQQVTYTYAQLLEQVAGFVGGHWSSFRPVWRIVCGA